MILRSSLIRSGLLTLGATLAGSAAWAVLMLGYQRAF